ncbi:vWA domain-containing protein [Rhizobium chutanense]|uniref:VWA domain-containing protein n=1 Tax=Rhizobium chutanense TaxID=2035448 RepID=A0A3S0T6T3_9HYPH|nr:TadE/TadG family type IV pilus assembly protein [Rhizobium chutanense]RUM09284.1 VWA domain-containing protein [Rhizobium chutanense]
MSTSFLHPCLRRMLSDRGGNFGIITAIVAPVLLAAAGMAIQVGDMLLSKQQLQEAADSAALATATALANGTIQTSEAQAYARNFVAGQMANYLQSGVDIKNATGVTVQTTKSGNSTSYQVTVSPGYDLMVNPLMQAVGFRTQHLSTSSTTVSGTSQTKSALSMELVLDQSGSMSYDTDTCDVYKRNGNCKTYVVKIDALKQASASLFDALDKADPQHALVRTGVISYSNGLLRDPWTNKVTSVSAMDWGTTKSRDYVKTISPSGGTDATEPMQTADDTIKKTADSTDAESVAHLKKSNSKVDRFIILMTDGEMTGNSSTWSKDKDQSVRDKCDQAKKDGITLFTVAFMAPDKGKSLLQYCASPGGNYYEAETMEKLVTDFESIAQTATKATTLLTN